MRRIPLVGKHGEGLFALVDDEDFKYLNQWRWHLSRWGYAATYIGNYHKIMMHQLILPPKRSYETDHKNRVRLDNQRSNLRYATRSQNVSNELRPNGKSGYRGVSQRVGRRRWDAFIRLEKKTIYLGSYVDAEDAAYVYDQAALQLFGEFAVTNFDWIS